ncbi:MAG: hypothetical protein R2867_42985 [Caldilineaceae bacterium]
MPCTIVFVPLLLAVLASFTLIPGTVETMAALRTRFQGCAGTTGYVDEMPAIVDSRTAKQGY